MNQKIWKIKQQLRGVLGLQRSYGLDALDLKLSQWLNYRNGFFIECGANDGITQSNTMFYERYRGWRGLLVEPVPELAAKCRLNRPQSIVEQCALVAPKDRGALIDFTYCNLMTAADGSMGSSGVTEEHISVGATIQRVKPYRFQATGWPLSELLDRHCIDHVDFFSLDVEGLEPAVLDGLDFNRHAPCFILVETRSKQELDKRLLPLYEMVAKLSVHDLLYRRRALDQ